MKEYYLDEHTAICPSCQSNKLNKKWVSEICNRNPEHFLFFAANDFHLIRYHRCLDYGYDSNYSFKVMLVEKVLSNYNLEGLYEVNKSVNFEHLFPNNRITEDLYFKKKITQINYIYSDNANRKYAITSKIDFKDWIFCQEKISENFIEAKKTLSEKNYCSDNLMSQLEDLFHNNCNLYRVDKINIIVKNSIDDIVKTIKKQLNEVG